MGLTLGCFFFSAGRAKPLLLILMVPGSAASQKGFSKRSGGQGAGVLSRAAESVPGMGNKASIHAKSVLLRAKPKPAPKASMGCPVTHERSPPLVWEDTKAWQERSCLGAAWGGPTPSISPGIPSQCHCRYGLRGCPGQRDAPQHLAGTAGVPRHIPIAVPSLQLPLITITPLVLCSSHVRWRKR